MPSICQYIEHQLLLNIYVPGRAGFPACVGPSTTLQAVVTGRPFQEASVYFAGPGNPRREKEDVLLTTMVSGSLKA